MQEPQGCRGEGQPGLRGPVVRHDADLFGEAASRRMVREVRSTHLLHLAWCTTPGLYWTSPENDEWVAASVRLEAFSEHGRRFVGVGTSAEYDWTRGVMMEEVTPLLPVREAVRRASGSGASRCGPEPR